MSPPKHSLPLPFHILVTRMLRPEAQIMHPHFWAFIAIHICCTHCCHHICCRICCTPVCICCTPFTSVAHPHSLHSHIHCTHLHLLLPLSAFIVPCICCTPSLVLVAFCHTLVTLTFVVNHYGIPPSLHLLHCYITYHFGLVLLIFCGIWIGFYSWTPPPFREGFLDIARHCHLWKFIGSLTGTRGW